MQVRVERGDIDFDTGTLLAQPAQDEVASHAVQVRAERPDARIEPIAMLHERDEHLLCDVFGGVRAAAHLPRKSVNHDLVSIKQRDECVAVSRPAQAEQLIVGLAGLCP